ncbi:hypothetical protein WUBG_16899, partial [Wuchereria bancrofti]
MSKRFWAELNDVPVVTPFSQMSSQGGSKKGLKRARKSYKSIVPRFTGMQSKRAYQATVAPETKFVDTGFTYTAQTATPTFTLMNPLVQGTTNGTRIGNKVQCRGLEVRAAVGLPAAPDNNTTMRVGIVVDFQSNGVVPTVGEIWNNGAAAPNVFASRNLNYIE